ncbi:MAG TPA: 4a-hydroxytetrahydrobiopterin dehydratase [Candidatus Binatia bacterium]|nr:4a-hydroxytetrahydrobiopterin dehydratase [Candidatus Binatia bacterium]
MQRLTTDEVQKQFSGLDGWTMEDGALKRDFGFKGFSTAIEFMNRMVPVAEKLDHHPDWTNSYNRVSVVLTTHSANGLTKKDFLFAQAANDVAKQLQR